MRPMRPFVLRASLEHVRDLQERGPTLARASVLYDIGHDLVPRLPRSRCLRRAPPGAHGARARES
jgi:hypothetical protein